MFFSQKWRRKVVLAHSACAPSGLANRARSHRVHPPWRRAEKSHPNRSRGRSVFEAVPGLSRFTLQNGGGQLGRKASGLPNERLSRPPPWPARLYPPWRRSRVSIPSAFAPDRFQGGVGPRPIAPPWFSRPDSHRDFRFRKSTAYVLADGKVVAICASNMIVIQTMKDRILRLRASGLSFRAITKRLGCSSSTVSYHCGVNGVKKRLELNRVTRKRRVRELKELLGSRCSICGYSRCLAALHFHHPNKDKEGCITRLAYSKHRVIKEAKKCHLVCANCHAELHEANRMTKVAPCAGLQPA